MDFEDSGDSGEELSASENVAAEVDARNQAVTEAGNEQTKAFHEELSGTTSKPERFGVGENSQGAKSALQRQVRSTESFVAVASAQAYAQTITFNLGGRGVSMNLGDMRNAASELRNSFGDKVRSGSASKKDKDKMRAYDGLINLLDQVAAGKASPEDVAAYIDQYDLGQDIAEAANANPDIEAIYTTTLSEEVAQKAAVSGQSLQDMISTISSNPA